MTVAAWQRQLAASDAVQAAVMQLEKVARGLQEGDLQEHCQKTAELMAAAPVDATVRDSLRQALQVSIFTFFYNFRFSFKFFPS